MFPYRARPVRRRAPGRSWCLWLGLACASAAPGCDHPTADPWSPNGLTYDSFGAGFTATYCRSCHSAGTPDRRGAPAGTDFDTEAEVQGLADSIRRTVLDDGTMPIGGGVQPVDLERLDEWLGCVQ